jgi:hypothetical protein
VLDHRRAAVVDDERLEPVRARIRPSPAVAEPGRRDRNAARVEDRQLEPDVLGVPDPIKKLAEVILGVI